jgi:hypothetical protein
MDIAADLGALAKRWGCNIRVFLGWVIFGRQNLQDQYGRLTHPQSL